MAAKLNCHRLHKVDLSLRLGATEPGAAACRPSDRSADSPGVPASDGTGPYGGRMTPSCTLRMKRLVNMWIAAAVILLISIGGTAAQPKSGAAAAQPKQILFLRPYGQNFEPWVTWSREIRIELIRQSPWPLDIQEHSLVTARNDDSTAEGKFVEYLGALYAQRPPDLIVAFGGPAARFVQQHRTDLFGSTPMLLAAVEVRRVAPSLLSEQGAPPSGPSPRSSTSAGRPPRLPLLSGTGQTTGRLYPRRSRRSG